MRALSIAATGMNAQQMRVEVISQNLANMSTTGYNPRRAEFADLPYQQVARPGTITSADGTMMPTGIQLGLGVRPSSVTFMPGQGTLKSTGGQLDVAIEGNGYLEIQLPSGISGYTRDGELKRNADGMIVTAAGDAVIPNIVIPDDARSVQINANGEVWASFVNVVQPQLLGQITLAGFPNEKGLEAIGGNLFLETPASGGAFVSTPGDQGLGTLRQGYLEESTVDSVREITDLIEAQRGYELNAKVITAADQMLGATTQIR